jgi:hypothetical protein
MRQCLSGNFLDVTSVWNGFFVGSFLRRKDAREMTSILSQYKFLKQSFVMHRIVRVGRGGTPYRLNSRGVKLAL